MDLRDAIYTRRSVRNYLDRPVEENVIRELLDAAVQAPSASNTQPWGFVVIQDRELLKAYSDKAKAKLLAVMEQNPGLQQYKTMLANPDFNIFYNAGTLIIIYARPATNFSVGDCCMAAQNLMLAAWDKGLGSCWIGFASVLVDSPEFKAQYGVPAEYSAVAPIIVGYHDMKSFTKAKNPPHVFNWHKSK